MSDTQRGGTAPVSGTGKTPGGRKNKMKRGAKFGRFSRKPKNARYKLHNRREQIKQRNINRKSALRDRENGDVSENCLKTRDKKARAAMVKSRDLDPKRYGTAAGERQFAGQMEDKGHEKPERLYLITATGKRLRIDRLTKGKLAA